MSYRLRSGSTASRRTLGRVQSYLNTPTNLSIASDADSHHASEVADHLEVIDPAVATVSTLAQIAQGILLPSYGASPTSVSVPQPVSENQKAEESENKHVSTNESSDTLDEHFTELLRTSTGKNLRKPQSTTKRVLVGLWAFLKTPLGWLVAVYGFLVVFWGAAIVIFLAGWIPMEKSTQDFWVEVDSQILTALLTLTGVGFIPWRVAATWHMYKIWSAKRIIRNRRRDMGIVESLEDEDELYDPNLDPDAIQVLNENEMVELKYHQEHFVARQAWYRPHANATHRAFPIKLALLNTLFSDGNSIFQCLLCGVMWGYATRYHDRPAWTTGCLIPLSFLCGIGAGVCIWLGGKRSRKTKEVKNKLCKVLSISRAGSPIRQKTGEDGTNEHSAAAVHSSDNDNKHLLMASAPLQTINSSSVLNLQDPVVSVAETR